MTNSAAKPALSTNGTSNRGTDIIQIFLADEDGQSILSIDDGAQRQSLRMIIVNTSGNEITLKGLEEPLTATNYHFRIAFRPGTLVDKGQGVTLAVENEQGSKIEGWQIQQADDTFYLGLNQSAAAAKSIAIGKRLTFVFGNIGASPAGGSRGTRVEVQFARLGFADSNADHSASISGTRLQYLNIVNQRGKKQIPLYAGFLGSNTILNDGSENELTLSIQSLPRQNLPLRIEPYFSDRFKDFQSVTSDHTSFGKTVFDLLQELPNFQNFLISIMNAVIDSGMPDNTTLSRIHGDQTIIRLFANQTVQIIQRIKQTIKQFIESIIKNGDINNFLNKQKTVKDLIWRDNQQSFLNAIFDSNSILTSLFIQLRLDRQYVLDLIPENVANLKPYQILREANKQSEKSAISDALIAGFELINTDDLRVILAGLKEINFESTEAALKNLSLIEFDDAKSITTNILKFKGIKSENTLDHTTANDTLDESVTIRISFDVATEQSDSKNWALVEKTNADKIQIPLPPGQNNWILGAKSTQGITPQWSFVCKQSLQLSDRQEILRLSIKNLKTQLLSGYANLYVHYENFPGYWDGFITVPIHKGPLVYREKDTAGCVGIGIDEPQAKLHVKSSTGVVGLKVEGDATITGNLSTQKVGIGTTPGTEQLRVEGDAVIVGKVSISASSQVKLDIKSTDGELLTVESEQRPNINLAGHIQLREYGENNLAYLQARDDMSNRDIGLRIRTQQRGDTNSPKLIDAVTILPNGNVGFGTGNPIEKLHVEGKTLINGIFEVKSRHDIMLGLQGGNGGGFRIGNNSGQDDSIWLQAFSKSDSKKSARRMIFSGMFDTTIDEILFNTKKVTNGSDLKLKKDIKNEKDILSRLMQLNVRSYRWKDSSKTSEKEIGFIAQEVRPVFPELVGEYRNSEEDEPTLTLQYTPFGVLAVGGLKELKMQKDAEIFDLRSEIFVLRDEFLKLKSELLAYKHIK